MKPRRHPPMPGLILGDYPERREIRTAPDLLALRCWLSARAPIARARTQALSQRCQRVQAIWAQLRAEGAGAWASHMPTLRAELARDGFASAAGERSCAVVCLAMEETLGRQLRPAQIMTALCVLDGTLAELPTGEGKTLAGALAACVAALAGVPVHAITSNDYLANRDAHMLQALAVRLDLNISAIEPGMNTAARRHAYAADITFCAARELVFDYLRDLHRKHERVLRGLCMAIIDEADSVLIDEAVTPFILSESIEEAAQRAACLHALRLARKMKPGFDFRIDSRDQSIRFAEQGQALIETETSADIPLWNMPRYRQEMTELAIRALYVLRRNIDYMLEDGKVKIIDAQSGRRAEGRSWSRGLHQMVELKERCTPTPGSRVIAQITFQRFFTRYHLLGGLSGTLIEARRELLEVYGLSVQRIPTGRAPSLKTLPPIICAHAQSSHALLLNEITRTLAKGRPILIGTDSVRESERISALLNAAGLPHKTLNARQDKEEAELIARAGQPGAITVTTNMAGRGTDVLIDEHVSHAGGLHVISCQHNSSRRIDRQLFGRAARLGQPGSARSMLSLEEGLLGRHIGPSWHKLLQKFASKNDDTMPLVVSKLLMHLVWFREENRGRKARQSLRKADEQNGRKHLFGSRPE